MLLEFRLSNFKSFRDTATFSMEAGSSDSLSNHVKVSGNGGYRALRSAVIYGANGAGKTNLMAGFNFMCNFILNSPNQAKNSQLTHPCYGFSEEYSQQPTEFVTVFTVNNEKYEYSFSFDKAQILAEKLVQYPEQGRLRTLFDRKLNDFNFSSTLQKGRGFKAVFDALQPNQLLISAPVKSDVLNLVYDFFKNCVFVYDYESLFEMTNRFIHLNIGNHNFKKLIEDILSRIDIGIEGVHVLKVTAEEAERRYPHLPDTIRDELVNRHKRQDIFEVFFKHNGSDRFVPFKDESKGTQKLYCLLGPILNSLQRNTVLFFDEFNSSMHPIFTEFVLDFVHNQEKILKVKTENQFIFNLHDTTLLTPQIFRGDQIWFVNKNEAGISDLYSLDDFKERSSLIQRNYLDGRYGAIPVIKRFA